MGLAYIQAVERLRGAASKDDIDFGAIDRLERIILSHTPRSAYEAYEMVSVLRTNVQAGQRCDQLDVRACDNLMEWLTTLSDA